MLMPTERSKLNLYAIFPIATRMQALNEIVMLGVRNYQAGGTTITDKGFPVRQASCTAVLSFMDQQY